MPTVTDYIVRHRKRSPRFLRRGDKNRPKDNVTKDEDSNSEQLSVQGASDSQEEGDGGAGTDEDSELDLPVRTTNSKANTCSSKSLSTSPERSIEDQIAALARKLQDLKSAADLRLLYPPQFASEFTPSSDIIPERQVLAEFITMKIPSPNPKDEKDFDEFNLENFCIYRAPYHPRGFQGQ